jgi:hypothetical protein
MDRITHQPPRQQGYGSTSSLRNDSLKHTRKHERREELNQGTKLPRTGGLSGQVGQTVRKGRTDCPAGYRRLSAPVPRTVRPSVADRPLNPTEPPVVNPEKWTVCGEHAGCPPGTRRLSARHTRTVRNLVQRKLKAMTDRKRKGGRTRRTHDEQQVVDRPPQARGLSAPYEQS